MSRRSQADQKARTRMTEKAPLPLVKADLGCVANPVVARVDRSYYKPLSQCFSASVMSDLIKKGRSEYLSYVLHESGYVSYLPEGATYLQLFDNLYDFLSSNYRSEYVYKNALALDIVVARHSPSEARILSELPVHSSKADIVIANGTSSVYEIKTEYDTTNRLASQIESYKQAFDKIFVVMHSSLLPTIKAMVDNSIGLMILNEDMTLETNREAKSNRKNVNPAVVFDILRRQEYLSIIQEKFGTVPCVPNGLIYSACKELFLEMSPTVAHDSMVSALRQRQSDVATEMIDNAPRSLTLMGLALGLTQKQRSSLICSLQRVYTYS